MPQAPRADLCTLPREISTCGDRGAQMPAHRGGAAHATGELHAIYTEPWYCSLLDTWPRSSSLSSLSDSTTPGWKKGEVLGHGNLPVASLSTRTLTGGCWLTDLYACDRKVRSFSNSLGLVWSVFLWIYLNIVEGLYKGISLHIIRGCIPFSIVTK